MNEGFTGFNPSQVNTQMREFDDYGFKIAVDLIGAYSDFFEVLQTAWCSQKAVEFGNKYIEALNYQITDLGLAYTNITYTAVKAYNIHARLDGLPTIDEGYNTPTEYGSIKWSNEGGRDISTIQLFDKNSEGVVGMNKIVVKAALNTFVKKVNMVLERVNNTPYNIAFFDETGEQQAAYKEEITRMANRVRETFTSMIESLNKSIGEEINTLELAKNQATESLRENA